MSSEFETNTAGSQAKGGKTRSSKVTFIKLCIHTDIIHRHRRGINMGGAGRGNNKNFIYL